MKMYESTRVGFIGLGNMGHPMAFNISRAGFALTVRDVNASLTRSVAESCAANAASAPVDFNDIDIVVTMLPTSAVVSEALFNWGEGIAANLAAGSVIIDMSSSDPTQTKKLGERLKDYGVDLLDAPVSGGVTKAASGELAIMLGGDSDAAIEKALPVIEAMSSTVFRTGSLGTGHAMKSLNNFVAAAATTAACEALVAGERFGLDQKVILRVLNSSTGRSWVTENVLGPHVIDRKFNSGFSLPLYAKDVGIARALATAVECPAPVCGAVSDTMNDALFALGDVDHSEAILHWEQERTNAET